MMKNKIFKTAVVLVSSIAILFCIIACEVGLGAAVDTAAPTVDISYPPKNAVIRDSFLVSGACDDDLELDRVEVTVTDSSTKKTYGPYTAKLGNDNKAWSVTLNKKTQGNYTAFNSYKQWEFSDGSYIISAVSYDKVGNASQTATIPVDVDNTAPVLLVSKPLAVGTENASVFGRTLNIIGDISETHETTKLTLNYLDTQTGLVTPLEISGFGTMSSDNPLVIAKLDKSSAEATNSVLTKNYEKIYGAGSIDLDNLNNYGKKLFYCGFLLEDNAKLYVNSGDSGSGEGNQTTQYYILSDDFNDNLFSENAYSLNARNLMLLLNGQSTYSESQISNITQELKKTGNSASSLNITSAQSSKFSIDPKNNPTWAITNFELNEGNFATYEKGSAVPLVLKAGGDGISIDKSSIEIKLYHLGNGDTPSEINENTPYLTLVRKGEYEDGKLKAALNPANENSLVFENPNNPTLDDKTLRVNHYYEFKLTGTDGSGNDIESEGGRYGFRLYSNSAAPKITFVTVNGFFKENEYKSGKELDKTGIKIKGKITTAKNDIEITGEDKIKVSAIKVSDTSTGVDFSSQIEFNTPVISNLTKTSDGSATEGKEYTFEALITKKTGATKTLQPSTKGSYKYEIGFVAEDSLFAKNEASIFEFKVDNKVPEIPAEEINVTPTVIKDNETKVNGTISVSGIVSDTGSGLKKLYWGIDVEHEIEDDDITVNNGEVVVSAARIAEENLTEITDASSPWSISVDTLPLDEDENPHTLKVFAIDSVGNIAVTPYRLNVDQDTDLPVITFTNDTAMFTKSSNKLAGSITDDDGLKTISAKYKKVSPVTGDETNIALGTFTQGTTSYGLSIPLPQNEEGEYDVTVTATDVPNLAKGTSTKTVRVTKDHGAPDFKITTSSSAGKWYKGDVSISGTVKDGSGSATITRQIYKVVFAADGKESTTSVGDATTLSSVGTAAEISSTTGKIWTDTIKVKSSTNTNGLTNGTYKAVYTAKDKYATNDENDTHTTQKEIYFSIDIEKPEVKTVSINGEIVDLNGYFNKNEGNFKVTVEDQTSGSGISSVQYNKSLESGNAQNVWKNMSGSGNEWTADISFTDTSIEKTFYLRAIDKAGNVSADNAFPVTIKMDTSAPILKDVSLSGNIYVNKKNDITFTCTYTEGSDDEDESGLKPLQFKIGSGNYVTIVPENSTYTIPKTEIPDAGGLLTLTGTDIATNTTSVMPCTFIVDKTDPEIKDIKLTSAYKESDVKYYFRRKNDEGNAAPLTIEGSATDNGGAFDKIELYLNGTKKSEETSSPWTFSVDLSAETEESATSAAIKLMAYDKAGNVKKEELTVIFDETKPVILSENDTTYGNATSVDFEINLKEEGSGISKLEYKLFTKQTTAPSYDAAGAVASGSFTPESATIGASIKYTATISGFEPASDEKTNYLLLRPIDNCGNTGTELARTVNVDQTPPAVSAINREYLTNGTKHIIISGTCSDEDSGIKALRVILNNDKAHPILKTDGTASNDYGNIIYPAEGDTRNWILELTPEKGNWFKNAGSLPIISIQAEDNAGNSAPNPVKVGTLKKDDDKPEIKSVNPETRASVNGSVTITGTTSDKTSTPEKLVLSWSETENDTYTELESLEVGKNGVAVSNLYNFSFTKEFSKLNDEDTVFIDKDIPSKDIWLKLVATDAAGNDSSECKLKYTIDRDTDRPEITISGENLTGKSENDPVILGEETFELNISDDDGIVTQAWYKVNDAASWTPITLNEGSGSITLDTNGKKTIEFKVTDPKGKTFYSKESDSTDGAHTWNCIKLHGTEETILYAVLDTEDPVVSIRQIATLPKVEDEDQPAPVWSDWADLAAFDKILGGATGSIKFKVAVQENGSGIKDKKLQAKILLNNTEITEAQYAADFKYESEYIGPEKDSDDKPTGYDIYNVTIPCSTGDGTITIQVVAEDKSGRSGVQDKSFPIDNTKPVINVTSPASDKEQSGSTIVKGGVSETVNLWYAISPLNSTAANPKSPDKYTSTTAFTYTKTDPDTGITSTGNAMAVPQTGLNTLCAYKPYSATTLNSFYVYFDGVDSADNHTEQLNTWLKNIGITTKEALEAQSNAFDDLVTLYLHLKAEDAAGNISEMAYPILIDPQGDRPKIDFSYPATTGQILGGTINVIGSISGKSAAYTVYMQIDQNGDGKYDNTDKIYLESKGYTLTEIPGLPGQYGIAIPVSGTVWSKKINENNEFNPTTTLQDSDGRRTINIRVYARDTQLSSAKTRTIKIDNDLPVIDQDVKLVQWEANATEKFDIEVVEKTVNGQTTKEGKIKLKNTKAVREYTDGMSVTGKWYVVGLVHDDSGISEVKLGDSDTAFDTATPGTPLSATALTSGDWTGAFIKSYTIGEGADAKTNYAFCFPVASDTQNSVGKSEVKFYAKDAVSDETKRNPVQRLFTVNYDNKAPVVEAPISSNRKIFNESGFYSFGTDAYEVSVVSGSQTVNQSGVERIAFYFTRGNKVFDPMIRVGKANNETTYSDSDVNANDGLIWKSASVTKVENSAVTISTVPGYVHKGGLAKVNGSIYLIKDITSTTITLDGNPGDDENGSSTTALFAIANVIDTSYTEEVPAEVKTKTSDYGYGYPDSEAFAGYDDGDLMPESCIASGSKWTWEATINSKNISDGNVTLHYVVFDKAGNATIRSATGTVQNNAPRLAGAIIGTDEDGNGTVDDGTVTGHPTEFTTYHYYDKGMNGITKVSELTIPKMKEGETQTSAIKIKRKTVIKPEIVGGNGELKYTYKIGDTDIVPVKSPASMGANGTADNESAYQSDGEIVINVIDLLKKNIADGLKKKFSFTIWDSTPGLTAGVDSQSATLHVYMDVAVNDITAPDNKIIPFYWKSLTDNSVTKKEASAINSIADLEGHIELSKDWTIISGGTDKIAKVWGDKDAKVSGAFKLEGIAQDNSLLKELKVKIGASEFLIAEYKATGWTKNSGTGWSTEITQATYGELADAATGSITRDTQGKLPDNLEEDALVPYASQKYGHVVHWIMYIDTEKIQIKNTDNSARTLPDADVAITASATDYGYPTKNAAETDVEYENGETSAPDATQIDVVPYITRIKTALSKKSQKTDTSEYDRTANGHYPVAVYSATESETITIEGFNLGGNMKFVKGNTTVQVAYAAAGVQIPLTATSGEISIVNNDVESLNNKNNDNAHGQFSIAANPGRDSYGSINTLTAFQNYYNRKPNKQNNYGLTDDTVIDVWQFNSQAAQRAADSGNISDPIMKINPNNGMIGFAYQSGDRRFSMANGNTNSYDPWVGDYDNLSATGFAYDSAGGTYGTALGGDINSSPSVSKFVFLRSAWGQSGLWDGGALNGSNARRFEQIGQVGTKADANAIATNQDCYVEYTKDTNDKIDKFRFVSPSIAVSGSGDTANVYLAYYDKMNSEIRFRWSGAGKDYIRDIYKDGDLGQNGGYARWAYNEWGQYVHNPGGTLEHTTREDVKNQSGRVVDPDNYCVLDFQIIAGSAEGTTSSLGNPGPYVALDVIPKGTKIGNTTLTYDIVVMVWYDEAAGNLMYTYNSKDLSTVAGTEFEGTAGTQTDWEDAKPIFEGAGQYCQIKADAKGGVHIAAYDAISGDVCYARLATYATEYNKDTMSCIVDSNGIVGSNLTLDVALDSEGGFAIPYISYYGSIGPKLAYLSEEGKEQASASGKTIADAPGTKSDMFTGYWEVTEIPSSYNVPKDRINVGVWKTKKTDTLAGGVLTVSTSTADGTTAVTKGNGTKNPVVAYEIRPTSATGYMETAQMK